MTTASERIREQHRGARQAEPVSRSREQSLQHHGLRYALVDDYTAIVESEFIFNLAASHWRSERTGAQGYTVIGLVDEVKRNSEKPPAARDSFAPDPDPDSQPGEAEAVGGDHLSMLPGGWP